MTNNKLRLNANKTDFITIDTSRQRSKLTHLFRGTSLVIISHHQTLYVIFNFRKHISLTCRSCFYHIRNLCRIRHYISLLVAKTIATALITSRLDYCNSLLYNIASKDILELQGVRNCLPRVVTRSPRFSHSVPLLKSPHWLPVYIASFSKSALLPIELFLLDNLHAYFPYFL